MPVANVAPVVPPHAVHADAKATPPLEKVLTGHAVAAPLPHQEPAAHGTGAELETTHVEPASQLAGVVTPEVGQNMLTVHAVHAEVVAPTPDAANDPAAQRLVHVLDWRPVALPYVPPGHAVTAVALAGQ